MKTILEKTSNFFLRNIKLIVFNLVLVGIFFPITYQQVVMFHESDYQAHINLARNFLLTGKLFFGEQCYPIH
jgi:hypothetical protein